MIPPEYSDPEPDRQLIFAYARARVVPHLHALFVIEKHFADIALSIRDPLVARIKLAWWREQGLRYAVPESGIEAELVLLRDQANITSKEWGALIDDWDEWLAQDRAGRPPFLGKETSALVAGICGQNAKPVRVLVALARSDAKRRASNRPPASIPLRILIALCA